MFIIFLFLQTRTKIHSNCHPRKPYNCHPQLDLGSTVTVILESTPTVILEIFYRGSSNLSSPKNTPLSSPTWLGIQANYFFINIKRRNTSWIPHQVRNDNTNVIPAKAGIHSSFFVILSLTENPQSLLSTKAHPLSSSKSFIEDPYYKPSFPSVSIGNPDFLIFFCI